jgi:hypothetical protein
MIVSCVSSQTFFNEVVGTYLPLSFRLRLYRGVESRLAVLCRASVVPCVTPASLLRPALLVERGPGTDRSLMAGAQFPGAAVLRKLAPPEAGARQIAHIMRCSRNRVKRILASALFGGSRAKSAVMGIY